MFLKTITKLDPLRRDLTFHAHMAKKMGHFPGCGAKFEPPVFTPRHRNAAARKGLEICPPDDFVELYYPEPLGALGSFRNIQDGSAKTADATGQVEPEGSATFGRWLFEVHARR